MLAHIHIRSQTDTNNYISMLCSFPSLYFSASYSYRASDIKHDYLDHLWLFGITIKFQPFELFYYFYIAYCKIFYFGQNGVNAWEPGNTCELHILVRLEVPTLVFLSETKIERERVSNLASRLCFEGCYHVSSDGLSGGLALFQSKEVHVTPTTFSGQHIEVKDKSIRGDEVHQILCESNKKRVSQQLGAKTTASGRWRDLGNAWLSLNCKIQVLMCAFHL